MTRQQSEQHQVWIDLAAIVAGLALVASRNFFVVLPRLPAAGLADERT